MISALIIAKNEEGNIGECLQSLQGFADEAVVIVDSSSNDGTKRVAEEKGARVFVKDWEGYSLTKTWGLARTNGDHILWIDADERMTPELALEIKSTIQSGPEFSALAFPRKAFFLGRWISHCGWYPGYVTRFFIKGRARFDDKQVHEGLIVEGVVKKLKEPLLHYTDPDLTHYMAKFNHYTQLAAEQMHAAGRRFRISDAFIKPFAFFTKMYIIKLGFLDGWEGFILCVLSAYYVLVKYLKLWELGLGEPTKEN